MNPLKITLADLSTQETDLIFAGLGKLPMEAVEQLVNKLRQQVAIQVSQYQATLQKESEPMDGNPVQ